MVEINDTRPATDASFVTFTNGMAKRNCEAFVKWIAEREVKRSQILSFTMNETEIEEGDNMLTVFYRNNPIESNEVPFEDLKFIHFNQQHSWEKLLQEAQSKKSGVDLVHLIQTPKNIGQSHNQFMWHAKGSNAAGTPTFKVLRREDGNWTELVGEVRDWMNRFVPPHMLISVSLFEDEHENVDKGINACITHSAGSDPQDLSDNQATKGAPLYDLQIIAGSGEWEDMFEEAKAKINAKGG